MCRYVKNELELELWPRITHLGKIEAMMAAVSVMREVAQLAIRTGLRNIIVKVIIKEQSRLLIAIFQISLTLVWLLNSLIQFSI